MSLWILLLIAFAILAFMTHPSLNYRKARRWRGERFAHRGLHDARAGVIENTLPAFEAARDQGFGMELDIQFSKDGEVVVFHDDTLSRLCGDERRVSQVPLSELQSLPLLGTDARVPTLKAVLEAVNGRVPLLIELKNGSSNRRLCRALVDMLADYPGEYLVESFNPLIVLWFRLHAPKVVRGQLVGPAQSYRPTVDPISGVFMAGLLFNFLSRPDFVAYDANAPRFFSPHFQRFLFHTPMAAWTVRDEGLARLVAKRREITIFEGRGRPA